MRTIRRQTVMTLKQLETLKARYERRIDNLKRELVVVMQKIEQTKKVLAKQELDHLNKLYEAVVKATSKKEAAAKVSEVIGDPININEVREVK